VKFIVASLMLLVSVQVNASLTSIDWLSSGDGLLTQDDNGLRWLDLSQTRGQSYYAVSAQLEVGGTFEGFRYATRDEVSGLWDSAGGDDDYYYGYSTQNNGVFDILAPYWGDLYCQVNACTPGDGYSSAFTSDEYDYNRVYSPFAFDDYFDTQRSNEDYFEIENISSKKQTHLTWASALVQISPVPIPATVWLFGTGILGLIGFSRRRKTAYRSAAKSWNRRMK